MDHKYTPEELRVLALHQQFINLSLPAGQDIVGRYILLSADGTPLGYGPLSAPGLAAATDALASLNARREAARNNAVNKADDVAGQPAPTVAVDPQLENELEEYCIGLNADDLMAKALKDPAAAVAEFDLITSDINEDGDTA